jgi:hypothetical protein
MSIVEIVSKTTGKVLGVINDLKHSVEQTEEWQAIQEAAKKAKGTKKGGGTKPPKPPKGGGSMGGGTRGGGY